MSTAGNPEPNDRLAALENELKSVKARLAAVERLLAVRRDNPNDDRAIREKARYDWQA